MTTIRKEQLFENFLWIDLTHPNTQQLRDLSETYGLDIILLHDSMQQGHLPKWEKYKDFYFVILRSYTANINDKFTKYGELSNKIAFFFNDKLMITIHRREFEFLKNISSTSSHPQELFLEISRHMVDSFDDPLKKLSEKIDQFERTIFLKKESDLSLEELYFMKSRARNGRKLLQLTQNVMYQLELRKELQTIFQDIKDSLTQSLLVYDEILDDSMNLLNTYLSITAQRNNDVIRVLTIFSAFFLPLTFIAGIYGMNFEHMPELKWPFGYFFCLIIMASVSLAIYFWFKRRRII